jgi:hypothetical protein
MTAKRATTILFPNEIVPFLIPGNVEVHRDDRPLRVRIIGKPSRPVTVNGEAHDEGDNDGGHADDGE